MRHKVILLALSIAMLSACSPPPAVAQDVGKQKQEQVIGMKYLAPTTCYALEPMPILNEAVCLVDPEVVQTANVPVTVPLQNSSKPLSTGLAIRMRDQLHLGVINLIIISTAGHRLLHIDPGLC